MVQIVKRASDVRIQEINLSQVIVGESASVACIPIIGTQGSTEPLMFTNPTDFLTEYGNPDPSKSMTIQSALNFMTEGNQLWGLRVAGTGAKYAAVVMYRDVDQKTKLMGVGVNDPLTVDQSTLVSNNQEAIALFYPPHGPGSYGDNTSIDISAGSLNPPQNVAATVSLTGGTLADGTYNFQVSALALNGESLASTPVSVTITGGNNTGSITLSWDQEAGAVGYNIYGRTTLGLGLLTVAGGSATSVIDTGSLVSDTTRQPITNSSNAYSTPVFTVNVYDETTGSKMESWNCTLAPQIDSTGAQMELEERINPFSLQLRVVSNVAALPAVPTVTSASKVAMSGGDSGTAPTSYQIANALQVFKNTQLYGTNLFINAGLSDPVLQLSLDTLVQARGDAVALLDTPATKQKYQAAIDYRNLELNLNSTYSALFNPDLLQADLINGQQIYCPPSGWVAALCARTDRVAGPAFSMAGLNRGLVNVLKQRYAFDDGQATAMFNAQVNYFRTFTGQGIALWEQQTMSSEFSALSWLSVRRIVNVIKVASYKFLLYALQEMNTDEVRRQLVNGMNSYLDTVVNSSGLNSYSVVCDSSNNPPAAANAGILVVSVVLVPNIPIHEIQLQIIVSKQGVSFAEVLTKVNGGA